MPKVQVTKKQVLEAALKVIIRDGHEQMSIKTVAAELGRSTQTISWTFGSMGCFRNEIVTYALSYANRKMHSDSDNPLEEYGRVGTAYIDLAFDEPNIIRFLRSDEKRLQAEGGFGQSFDKATMHERALAFAKIYDCTPEKAESFMLDMLIYTQGLVSMILAGGTGIDKTTAYKMLGNISGICLASIKGKR